MSTVVRFGFLGVVFCVIGWPPITAMAQSATSMDVAKPVIVGDLYQAGGAVRVSSGVDGDVVAAGGTLSVTEAVSQDVIAAGGLVTITADTGDDLRLAGGAVTIIGNVGSDLTAAGAVVTLDSASTVTGKAQLAGQVVHVDGNVAGDVHVTGGRVRLAGHLGANVEIDAESIDIEPGAVIRGNLTYSAPDELVVVEGVVIEGEVERIDFALGQVETWGPAMMGKLKSLFSLILSASVLFLLLPQFTATVVDRANESLLKALGLGLAVMASSAVLIVVMLFSGLATALSLTALGLYLALLFGGWLIGLIWLGSVSMRLMDRTADASKWTRVGSVVIAALVLLILGSIPYLGFLSVFITTLMGIGAMSLQLKTLYIR